MKHKFKNGDCFSIKGMNYEEFIKIHQLLEDYGCNMFESTSKRKEWGKPDYTYFKVNDGQWCGSENPINIISVYDIQKIISGETTYEIY